jgi:hypothetical protein
MLLKKDFVTASGNEGRNINDWITGPLHPCFSPESGIGLLYMAGLLARLLMIPFPSAFAKASADSGSGSSGG